MNKRQISASLYWPGCLNCDPSALIAIAQVALGLALILAGAWIFWRMRHD